MKMIVAMVANAQRNRMSWSEEFYGGGSAADVVLLYSDISRADFNAKSPTKKYIEVPEEDRGAHTGNEQGRRCARLLVPMYGTRDAALAWERHYASWMTEK